jgi:hypothetical protein
MKRFTLLSVLCVFISFLVSATVRTVSNFPANVAQYNDIQSAINASANGDTVYVHGSPNNYAAFTITDKMVTILGPGWLPDKQLPFTAMVLGGTITNSVGTSSGTEIHGLDFVSGGLSFPAGITISNIKIIRNRFRSAVNFVGGAFSSYTGFLIEGNWFDNTGNINMYTLDAATNFIIHNNIFFDQSGYQQIYGFSNASNVLVDHNLFYGAAYDAFGQCKFLLITNNIFVHRNAANGSTSTVSCTYNNNITYLTGNDAPWSSNGNTDGGGNVAGTNPQMTDEAAVEANTNNPLLNFTIAAGPANNAGSDGKDMGLLYDVSGSLNWTNSRGSRMPFIYSMNVTTPTVAPGGNVSVTVESRRNN